MVWGSLTTEWACSGKCHQVVKLNVQNCVSAFQIGRRGEGTKGVLEATTHENVKPVALKRVELKSS